jgi:membrane-associated phospholipid phosphatase
MDPIYDLGIQLIQALQSLSPALDGVMKFISFLGTIQFYIILIPLIYWLVDSSLGIRVLVVLISTDFFGVALKQLLHQPRPYWVGDVKALAEETSYGIPSTHSSDSMAVWGYLLYHLKKSWLWVVSILLILLIGFSRMYLGVHFPQDVLGGWLLGLVVLVVFVAAETRVASWFNKFSASAQIGLGFGVSLLMILVGWLILLLISSSPDPAEWAEYSTEARSILHYITLGGFFFGALAGYVLMRQYARFTTKGSWWQLLIRYGVGLAGVLLIYFGLDVVFGMVAADETALGMLLRYIRYSAVSLWGIFGAPWVFLKLKLAEPVQAE